MVALTGCGPAPYSWTGGTWAFSPNGEQIAYLSGIGADRTGTLNVQPSLGGSVTEIAPRVAVRSFAFSPDGSRIVFQDQRASLWVQPASGGASPVRIADNVSTGNVWFAPDGAAVVFGHDCAATCALSRWRFSDASTEDLNPAVPPFISVVGFSADQAWLVIRDAAADLWVVPRGMGAPALVARGVSGCRMTPEGQHVTFMTGHTLHLAPVDGSGGDLVLANDVDLGGAVFSPDGSRAFFYPTLSRTLMLVSASGGTATQVATEVSGASFSPDGSQLAFVVTGDLNGFGELQTVPTSGGAPTTIASEAGRAQFLPDGRLLFMTRWSSSSGSGTVALGSAAASPIMLGDGVSTVVVAPGGTRAAFIANVRDGELTGTLSTTMLTGEPAGRVADDAGDFRFSPDGTLLGFVRGVHPLSATAPVGVGTLEVVPAAGGAPIHIADQ